jgi:nucleotide-binding universal stress UspA family protein
MPDNYDYDQIPLRTILVPLDGSEWSFRAASYAIKIAKMAGAEIVCVHAVSSLPYAAYASVGMLIQQFMEAAEKEAQKWYDEVNAIAAKAGVKMRAETLLDVVSIVDSITSYAERNNVDLITIGTKGRTGLKKLVLGSVADGVVSHSKSPVLVVR